MGFGGIPIMSGKDSEFLVRLYSISDCNDGCNTMGLSCQGDVFSLQKNPGTVLFAAAHIEKTRPRRYDEILFFFKAVFTALFSCWFQCQLSFPNAA